MFFFLLFFVVLLPGYGGMSRTSDGTFGYEALNATYHLAPNKLLVGTEGCNCPNVKLGDWLRAERLAHDVMYDVNNYAQGWIDWNLIVDHEGGINHLGNLCDASLVCKPDFSDVIVQPKFHYFGHISKFVEPDEAVRIESSIVGDFEYAEMEPNVQAQLEVGMYACEKSARQLWNFNLDTFRVELLTPTVDAFNEITVAQAAEWGERRLSSEDPNKEKTEKSSGNNKKDDRELKKFTMCLSAGDETRPFLKIIDCDSKDPNSKDKPLHVERNSLGQLMDLNTGMCIGMSGTAREHGALLDLSPCGNGADNAPGASQERIDNFYRQVFPVNYSTGEIKAAPQYVGDDVELCLTAGWPYLSSTAFYNENKKQTTVVVLNEAPVGTHVLLDDATKLRKMGLAMPPRSMQTIVY